MNSHYHCLTQSYPQTTRYTTDTDSVYDRRLVLSTRYSTDGDTVFDRRKARYTTDAN